MHSGFNLILPQFESVFRIRDIVIRIRILLFSLMAFKMQTKINLKGFLLSTYGTVVTFTRMSVFEDGKS
jgi:hypothetical protein